MEGGSACFAWSAASTHHMLDMPMSQPCVRTAPLGEGGGSSQIRSGSGPSGGQAGGLGCWSCCIYAAAAGTYGACNAQCRRACMQAGRRAVRTLMTWPRPRVKVKGELRSTEESNLVPSISLPCAAQRSTAMLRCRGGEGRGGRGGHAQAEWESMRGHEAHAVTSSLTVQTLHAACSTLMHARKAGRKDRGKVLV